MLAMANGMQSGRLAHAARTRNINELLHALPKLDLKGSATASDMASYVLRCLSCRAGPRNVHCKRAVQREMEIVRTASGELGT